MKKLYFLITLIGLAGAAEAQDWLGFHSSNYAGVQGISFQPASIADSRYKFQMNIIGVSTSFENNYYSIPNSDFKKFEIDGDRLIESDKDSKKGGFLSADVYAPVSFMLTLSPKHAMALTLRGRSVFNFDGLSSPNSRFLG